MLYAIYGILIQLYGLAIRLASLKSEKAAAWIEGRRLQHIPEKKDSNKRIWMHCASLGEYEQGKPIFEQLKLLFPEAEFILSFYSPSGYKWVENEAAHHVFYLPLDTQKATSEFLDKLNPDCAIIVKYEFWLNLFTQVWKRQIPLYLVAVRIRKNHFLLRFPFKRFGKTLFACVDRFFVQQESDAEQLKDYPVTVCGDSRIDRVCEIASQSFTAPEVEEWKGDYKLLIAGSTWREDEEILLDALDELDIKVLLLPHESISFPSLAHVEEPEELSKMHNEKVVYVCKRGILSKLYRYADYCYVGGGFKTGLHNTLEAAVYGKPVFFGPEYKKFVEAQELVMRGAGFSLKAKDDLVNKMKVLLEDDKKYESSCKSAAEYVLENKGAALKTARGIASELSSLAWK